MTVRSLTEEQIASLRVVVAGPTPLVRGGDTRNVVIHMRVARELELLGLVTVRPLNGDAMAYPTVMGRSVLAAIDRAPAQKGIVVS